MTKRVLIVEDDTLTGMDIASQLERFGYTPLGPTHTVEAALEHLGQQECQAAILDVNLGPETSEPVAKALRDLGLPFILISGYTCDQHPASLQGNDSLTKPIDFPQLEAWLARRLVPAS